MGQRRHRRQTLYSSGSSRDLKSRQKKADVQQKFVLLGKGEILVTGRAIGQKIGAGKVRIVADPEQMDLVQEGDVLVTEMTDPNWEPVMKEASAIVTNRGGRTTQLLLLVSSVSPLLSAAATLPKSSKTVWKLPSPAPKAIQAIFTTA